MKNLDLQIKMIKYQNIVKKDPCDHGSYRIIADPNALLGPAYEYDGLECLGF